MSFLNKSLMAALVCSAISSPALAAKHNPGEYVYNITRDAYATVLGVASDGSYVIQFDSGTLKGQTGSNWTDNDLATTSGCYGRFCVGESTYNITSNAYVTIIGLQNNGGYAVLFTSETLINQTGHGWGDADLAKLSGCSSNHLCVGVNAFNTTDQAQVVIVGIEANGALVVQFTSGSLAGQIGHDWSPQALVYEPVGPTPPPATPTPAPPVTLPAPPVTQITCVIRLGGSASGQQTFNVVTTDGAIIATFSTSEQAATFAEQDPRCHS